MITLALVAMGWWLFKTDNGLNERAELGLFALFFALITLAVEGTLYLIVLELLLIPKAL